MSSLNRVILIGNLGRDPEVRTFPSGDRVANVSIATTDRWKDKDSGEMKEATEWHRVVFNGRLAEIAGEYLRKGSQICVEGSLRTRKWTDKDNIERYTTEIRADNMKMLGSRPDGGGDRDDDRGGQRQQRQAPPARGSGNSAGGRTDNRRAPPARGGGSSGFDDLEDDIPF